MQNHHHHQHQNYSHTQRHKRIWRKDLFEVRLFPSYCVNLFCPWAPMYHLMNRLLINQQHSSVESSTCCYEHITPMSAAHSCITCILPCGLCTNSIVHYATETEEEEEDNETYHNSTWLPDELNMFTSHNNMHEEEQQANTLSKTLTQHYTMPAVCVGIACMFPSMYWIRRVVDSTLHKTHNESMWDTGLITCLAWPCSLTQMIEEMDEYETPIKRTHPMHSFSHDEEEHNEAYYDEDSHA